MTYATDRRSYGDACAAAHAMDLLGERWALLVVRELMTGPKRFSELRAGLPGISANVLTQRLEGLAAAGVLTRRTLPPPASVAVYELTPWGYEAEPVFRALGRWGVRSPRHDPTAAFSAASLVLSLRTMFAPDRAAGLTLTVALRTDRRTWRAAVRDGALTVAEGGAEGADVVAEGDPAAIAGAIYGGAPPETVVVAGDPGAFARFARLFPLPSKAGGPTARP